MTEEKAPQKNEEAPEAGTPAQEARPTPLTRREKYLWGLCWLIIVIILAAHQYLDSQFSRPADPDAHGTVRIHILPRTTFRQTLRLLEENGLLRSPRLFHLQARLRGGAKKIQAGVYDLSPSMSARAILRHLLEGRVVRHTFTIPEGLNLREIAQTIHDEKLADREEILRLSRNPPFLRELNIPADSLEGYLFPDTYHFTAGTPARKVLEFMVLTLRKKFTPALREEAKAKGFTVHQTLTLASIIEKETDLDSERPIIAGVFVNRLRRRMRLQSDPTVIYGLPDFDGNLTRKDLRYDSPYNTYVYPGLPPGPIASPGLASIKAVLRPAEVKYLYFVATGNGGHKFSRTYREHRRAVRRYQRR